MKDATEQQYGWDPLESRIVAEAYKWRVHPMTGHPMSRLDRFRVYKVFGFWRVIPPDCPKCSVIVIWARWSSWESAMRHVDAMLKKHVAHTPTQPARPGRVSARTVIAAKAGLA